MAPKDRKDAAWVHCQLVEGKIVCNYCQKEVGRGGINRLKQHLAGTRGNVRPCLKVPDDLRAEMLGLLESYQAEKSKNKRVQREIGRSCSSDFLERNPSFEESSSFPSPIHDPIPFLGNKMLQLVVLVAVHPNLKNPVVALSLSFNPALPLVLSPPLMPNGRWKRRLLGNALLDGGMMQRYHSMLQGRYIINLCWML